MVRLEHVSYAYDEKSDGVNNVNLVVNDGEFCFVTGKSGSGKSTLSKLITGELKPDTGLVTVNNYQLNDLRGKAISEMRRTVGMVFQDFRLIRSMSVEENLEFAMKCVNASNAITKKRIPEVLDLVGLTGKENRRPYELSGGEQQRVSIARAIINKPSLIVADEPTGNLDPSLAEGIMNLFIQINASGTTTMVITHAAGLVKKFKQRVIYMEDGIIAQDWAKSLYEKGGSKL